MADEKWQTEEDLSKWLKDRGIYADEDAKRNSLAQNMLKEDMTSVAAIGNAPLDLKKVLGVSLGVANLLVANNTAPSATGSGQNQQGLTLEELRAEERRLDAWLAEHGYAVDDFDMDVDALVGQTLDIHIDQSTCQGQWTKGSVVCVTVCALLGRNDKTIVCSVALDQGDVDARYAVKVARSTSENFQDEYDMLQRLQGIDGVPGVKCLGWVDVGGSIAPVLITQGVGVSTRDLLMDGGVHTGDLTSGNGLKYFQWSQIEQVACDIVGTLCDVHRRGILHRDICPSNIILLHGRYQLIDFGSAGTLGASDFDSVEQARTFPVQQAYASERMLHTSDPLDEEDDYFALVATLTRLHCGQKTAGLRQTALVCRLRAAKANGCKAQETKLHLFKRHAEAVELVIADLKSRCTILMKALGEQQ